MKSQPSANMNETQDIHRFYQHHKPYTSTEMHVFFSIAGWLKFNDNHNNVGYIVHSVL